MLKNSKFFKIMKGNFYGIISVNSDYLEVNLSDKIRMGQIYFAKNNLEIPTSDKYEIFCFKDDFLKKEDEKTYIMKHYTVNEEIINLKVTSYPLTLGEIFDMVNKLTASQVDEFVKQNKSLLFQLRTLKELNNEINNISLKSLEMILDLVLDFRENSSFKILDESSMFYFNELIPINLVEKYKKKIISNLNINLLRDYTWYNHDYLTDYNILSSLDLLSCKDSCLYNFVEKRFCICIKNQYTVDFLGKENTPLYFNLLNSTIRKFSDSVGINSFEKIVQNSEKNLIFFKNNDNSFIEFGDTANSNTKKKVQKIGIKSFEDTGFFIRNWGDNSQFILKTKTKSGIHSHCDDGSFIYNCMGHQIFIDPGLHKYDESDHIRKLTRSLFGHNVAHVSNKYNIFANELNSKMRHNAEFNLFNTSFFPVTVLKNFWEDCEYIMLKNSWYERNQFFQEFQMFNSCTFKITYFASSEVKITQRLNLDYIFNDALITHVKNSLLIVNEIIEIKIQSNLIFNFFETQNYKCIQNTDYKTIRQLHISRIISEEKFEMYISVNIKENRGL